MESPQRPYSTDFCVKEAHPVKIQDNKGQYKVTIPKDIAKLKGWKQGTHVVIILDAEGNVLVREIEHKEEQHEG